MDYGSTMSAGTSEENGSSTMRLNSDATNDNGSPPLTRQQKIIKAGLLLALILIVVYVILDYTVSTYMYTSCACMR